jgi:AraC-like DNA-binding protein
MYREYFISTDNRKSFDAFFLNVSTMTLSCFLNKMLFFHYALNKTPLLISDIIDISQSQNLHNIANKQAENMYNNKENGFFNNSFEIEQKLINMIESGNLEELKSFTIDSPTIHEGIIASTAIRQVKNTSIVMITLATRAAIRGGVPNDIAFQLSDLYIQKLEQLTTIESIYQLNYEAMYDFTNRVSDSQIPITTDDAIQKAIKYVLKNTNVHLTVSDVAAHLGFSRAYFTHRFKKELGFDLSAYIIRCKLEEAKYLLAYTDKSISDISNYLCFSSQSHFQTTFKKQFGITPLEYRKNPTR